MTFLYTGSFALGILFTLWATYSFFSQRHILQNSERAEAEVVELIAQVGVSRKHGSPLLPVFVFTCSKGQEHRIRGKMAQAPSPYSIGDRVELVYDAEAVEQTARIANSWNNYLEAILLLCLAAVCFLFGLVVFLYKLRGH